jgi:hypothetical protein
MALALHPEHGTLIERLIVVDISPAEGSPAPEFARYIQAMRDIRSSSICTKEEADVYLQTIARDANQRANLLSNLVTGQDGSLRWRISLDNIEEGLGNIGDFPYKPGSRAFERPTLFVKGELSKYLNRKSLAVCEQYFPRMRLETLKGVGHASASAACSRRSDMSRSPPRGS